MKRGVFVFVVIAFALISAFVLYSDLSTKEVDSDEEDARDVFDKISATALDISLQPGPTNPPNKPTGLTATPLSTTEIRLNWVQGISPPDEEGFVLQFRLIGDGVWNDIFVSGADVFSFTHTGLSEGLSYEYQVYAFNGFGNSPIEGPIPTQTFSTPVILSLSPSPIYTNHTGDVTMTGNNFVLQTGLNPQFGILVRLQGDPNWATLCVGGDGSCKSISETTVQFPLPLPVVGNYELSYVNIAGSTPIFSNIFLFTIVKGVPRAPTNLVATGLSSSEISLTWNDNSHNEDNYEIERRQLPSGSFVTIATLGFDNETYADTGLSSNTDYEYRVRAVNDLGPSPYSIPASGSTSAPSTCDSFNSEATCPITTCRWCVGCNANNQYNNIGDKCIPIVQQCPADYQCSINPIRQCNADCDATSGCTSSQSCNLNSCGCTDQNPSVGTIVSLVTAWSQGGGTVILSGNYFNSNSKLFVNGVELNSIRLTIDTATLPHTISFVRNAEEFNVGVNEFVVENSATSRSNNAYLTLTSTPTITSLNPGAIRYNAQAFVDIIGSDFDPSPNARVFMNGIDITFLTSRSNSQLMVLNVPAGNQLIPADYQITVQNGDNSFTSSPATLRINALFDYNLIVNGSVFNMNSSEVIESSVAVQSSVYMFQENVDVVVTSSQGVGINFLENPSCTPSITIPEAPGALNCKMYFNIVTNNVADREYTVWFNATSNTSLIEHVTNITVNVSNLPRELCGNGFCSATAGETCSSCPTDCGACPPSGSSGGGGGGGGGGAPKKILQQCEDKKDNDGDGKVDYPADTGCTGLTDTSETDPTDLVRSNYTLGEGDDTPDDLLSEEKDIEIKVVFWIVLIALIVGIMAVSTIILRIILESKTKALLAKSGINNAPSSVRRF